MKKLIIENRTTLPMHEAMSYAVVIIRQGRVSGMKKDQYCYHSLFKDGITVSSWKNKKSDRLVIGESDA